MLEYHIATGEMLLNGKLLGKGYSGAPQDKNDPAATALKGLGPIPAGTYHLTGVENGGPTGPFTIVLVPAAGMDTHGRGDFRIHGDSIADPGTASHGCIILAHSVREAIWNSGVREMTVA